MKQQNPTGSEEASSAPHSSAKPRMSKSELTERLHNLQTSEAEGNELKEVLHELEVSQIELEIQNRELNESQGRLAQSLDRYVALYDFAPIGFVTLDHLGMIKDANLTFARMLETDRAALVNRPLAPWILVPDLKYFRRHIQRCGVGDVQVRTELRLSRKDKSIVHVELLSRQCIDSSIDTEFTLTAVTDITERKNAEAERDRFFDLSNDLLSISGTDGFFKRINPAWEKVTGFSRTELLAHPFVCFVHPDDRELAHKILSATNGIKRSENFQIRLTKQNRETIWLTWTSVVTDNIVYSVARDTSADHFEKVAIENDQRWLRAMIEAIPTAMALIAVEGERVISRSSGLVKLTSDLKLDIPIYDQPDFICEDDRGNRLQGEDLPTRRAARGHVLCGEQIVWRTSKGTTYLKVFSRNIEASYGREAMALITYQDITDLKETEKSLLTAVQKLENERELRERFVSTLTHDLRTPLTAVKMSSQLILKRGENVATVQLLADRVLENVDRMDHMVHDLLDANRINAGEKLALKTEDCDLVALVKKSLESLKTIYGERFELSGLDVCSSVVEPMAIRRVIENLCTNAIKYGAADTPVKVSVLKSPGRLRILVHNSGDAISVEDQKTLFFPFQRTSSAQSSGKKGWGIGLTLIRGIVESHGGSVHLTSTKGEGTTFEVSLPDAAASTREP